MKIRLTLSLLLLGNVLMAEDFNPRKVVPAFEAITEAPIASVEEAGKWVEDPELVLGVVVNGAARAYPINQLTKPTREIINDTLGDRSIAATW